MTRFLIILMLAYTPTAPAHAATSCPADPLQASYKVWPGNTISPGKTQSSFHPCGKRLECTGGNLAGGGLMKRSCRWAN